MEKGLQASGKRTSVPVVQGPILSAVDGGVAADVQAWEARAQIDVALLIDRYLAESPPPGESHHAELFALWSRQCRAAGEARLASLGARRLRQAG